MGICGLPENYNDWLIMREEHMEENLISSHFTIDLYKQYRKHLGPVRYELLKQAQVLVVPKKVNSLLSLGNLPLLKPVIQAYKIARCFRLGNWIKNLIMPQDYKARIAGLDVISNA